MFDDIDKQLKEQREKGHDISQRILALQNLIKEAKELDLDTVTGEHYLQTAKKNMKDNNWESAAENITKAEDILATEIRSALEEYEAYARVGKAKSERRGEAGLPAGSDPALQ